MLVAAVFGARPELFEEVETRLVERYGPIGLRGDLFAFDHTDYYTPSMGPDLRKYLIGFQYLVDPEHLAAVKQDTNALEAGFAGRGGSGPVRPVNVDPGYVSASKFVLATTKDYSHRVYLRHGIYAEVTLHYTKGDFVPWPWTYPDYRSRAVRDFLCQARQWYLGRLNAQAHGPAD